MNWYKMSGVCSLKLFSSYINKLPIEFKGLILQTAFVVKKSFSRRISSRLFIWAFLENIRLTYCLLLSLLCASFWDSNSKCSGSSELVFEQPFTDLLSGRYTDEFEGRKCCLQMASRQEDKICAKRCLVIQRQNNTSHFSPI